MTLNIFRSRKRIKEIKEVKLNNFMEVTSMKRTQIFNNSDVNGIKSDFASKTTTTDVEVSEYKGNPIISIPLGSGKTFCFGYRKATAIIYHAQEIVDFVSLCDRVSDKKQGFDS